MTDITLAAARPRTTAWPRWFGAAAGFLLGLVLLYSSWAKALDPHGTGEIYARKGLLPASLATAVVLAGVGVEAALAFALLSNFRRRLVLLGATLLMLGFFGLTTYEFFVPSKDASSCGCFGNLIVRTPGQAVIQDGLFLVFALFAWVGAPRGRAPLARWAVPVAGFVLAVTLGVLAPKLPVDNLATRLKPGVKVASLKIDEILPELQRGRSFVILIDRGDEKMVDQVKRINEQLALKQGLPLNVLGLAEDNENLATQFQWSAGPAFEVRSAPYTTIKPLYRKLPRSFVVQDGVVTRVWNGIPDDATLTSLAEGRTR